MTGRLSGIAERFEELNWEMLQENEENRRKKRMKSNRINKQRISKNSLYARLFNGEHVRKRDVVLGERRRARLRNLPDDLTHEQMAEILDHFDGACALSGDTGDGHLDHVIPISIGHGGTIRENMIPLRADLNISKHARNIFDWFADNRERFGLEQRRFDELITYLADINGMSTQEYEEYVRWCHDNPRDLTKEDDDATA